MSNTNTLKNITGTIVLAGAGKMGGAMLTGWLAGGLNAEQVFVLEPHPSDDIKALAAKGVRLNPRPSIAARNAGRRRKTAKLPRSRADAERVRRLVHAGGLDHGGHHQSRRCEEVCGGMVVRSMPNTPAAIGRGITVAVPAKSVSAAQRATADALLRAIGSVEWVEDEKLMDAVTAVSGSGPAYVFLLAEELARAGVEAGLAGGAGDQARARNRRRLRRAAASLGPAGGDLAPERHLARRHHTGRAGSADGERWTAAADDPRDCGGDEAVDRTGEVIDLVRRRAAPRQAAHPHRGLDRDARFALPRSEQAYFAASRSLNFATLITPRA